MPLSFNIALRSIKGLFLKFKDKLSKCYNDEIAITEEKVKAEILRRKRTGPEAVLDWGRKRSLLPRH